MGIRDKAFSWASGLLLRQSGNARASGYDFGQEDHVLVEDRGSDVTVFCFAGLAVMFAGLPTFEFRRILNEHGRDFNLVFFRDVQRSAYHLTPDGQPGGLQFYENEVRRLMKSLGSTYNVALGASAGGGAAFYFGTRCGMDQVVTFSPGFPGSVYTRPSMQLRTFLNVPRLLTQPAAYVELVLVTLGAVWVTRALRKKLDRYWNVYETYQNSRETRPRATIFYGRRCGPDSLQARLMSGFPEVKLVPLPSARHNCASVLKRQGALGSAIVAEILEGLRSARGEVRRQRA